MIRNIIILIFLFIAYNNLRAEERIKIAIVDTGISEAQSKLKSTCKNGVYGYTGNKGIDDNGHGANIYGIISKKLNTKTHCIMSFKVFYKNPTMSEKNLINTHIIAAIEKATKLRAKFINLSLSGPEYASREKEVIEKAVQRGIYVVVAAGNDGLNLDRNCNIYPACYKKYINSDYLRVVTTHYLKHSNRGKIVTDKASGTDVEGGGIALSGTSQATAQITGKLINK